jgi:single-stranded-DNA-specific exonuclease
VDCGISDHEQIAYAASLGIDTIVLDHHEISGELPAAVAKYQP